MKSESGNHSHLLDGNQETQGLGLKKNGQESLGEQHKVKDSQEKTQTGTQEHWQPLLKALEKVAQTLLQFGPFQNEVTTCKNDGKRIKP